METPHTDPKKPRLLIIGASARAAAMSAIRAGYQPICADLFADVDLQRVATAVQVKNYPQGLADNAAGIAPGDWMYVGALENHPAIVSEISARHRLLGNGPKSISEARDPLRIMSFLRAMGFPALEVRAGDNPPRNDGNWLRKPLRSAAGVGIRVEKPGFSKKPGFFPRSTSQRSPTSPISHYYQQLGTGEPISATFVAFENHTDFVGVTRQLIGVPEWNAESFGYCGSIGPLELPPATNTLIKSMGSAIATEFQLRGLFGLDLLWDASDVRLTEINPRYTASIEVLEWATGRTLVAEHAAACGATDLPPTVRDRHHQSDSPIVGKAIVFAAREFQVSSFPRSNSPVGIPNLADIPASGTLIRPGEPICTVLAQNSSVAGCREELAVRAAEILQLSGGQRR